MKRMICMVMAMLAAGMAMGATRLVPRLLVLESAAWTFRVYLWMDVEQEGITLRFDGEQVVGCRVGYYGSGMELYALGTAGSYCSMEDGIYKVSDSYSAHARASDRFPDGATLNWKFLIFWEYEESEE